MIINIVNWNEHIYKIISNFKCSKNFENWNIDVKNIFVIYNYN